MRRNLGEIVVAGFLLAMSTIAGAQETSELPGLTPGTQQAQPAAKPQPAKKETMPPKSAQPETAPPETSPTESVQQPAPQEARPPEATETETAGEAEPAAGVEWRASVNLQGDALLNSTLPSDRQKTTALRRARLGGQMLVGDGMRISTSADFSRGAHLRDLYLELRKTSIYWAFGRFPEPFGLAAQESSRTSLMMEHPEPTAIGPGYGVGAAANFTGLRWGLTLGLFKAQGTVSDEDALKGVRKEDAISGRFTYGAFRTEDRLVHFGISLSSRHPKGDTLRFVAIPESILVKGLQVSSGLVPVDEGMSYAATSAEFAFAKGPVLIQSEWIAAELPGLGPFGVLSYHGYYVEGGWVLTGERRPYSTRRGVFGPINPGTPWNEGSHGAWEIAMRRSVTDFSGNPFQDLDQFLGDEFFAAFGSVTTGGRGVVTSLGLNWYPTPLTRASLDGLRIEKTRKEVSESVNAIQMRLYFQFDLPRE